jgi:hypothetical protein
MRVDTIAVRPLSLEYDLARSSFSFTGPDDGVG